MLYFFHRYELPRVEHDRHHSTARIPLIVGGHQLVAILHTPIRPFPHISLAVFAANDHDNREIDEEDMSDNDNTVDTNTTTIPNSSSSTTDSSTANTRNRFYQNSETLLRRPL